MPGGTRVGIVRVAVAATLALVAVASFLPGARLWGIDHLAYYPPWVRVAALAVVLASFVPAVAGRVYRALLALARFVGEGRRSAENVLTVVAVGSVAVFAGLRSATNLLGDGQLIADNFRLAAEGAPNAVARSVPAILAGEPVARGASLLYYAAARFATNVLHQSPVYGIRYINCLLGAALVWMFLGFLRESKMSRETRLWLLVLVLFSSSIELFFGYVENYTPLVFLLFLYAAAGLSVARGTGRMWRPVVLLVLAVFVHVQAVLFVPSLVLLPRLGAGDKRTVRHGAWIVTLLALAGAVAASFVPRLDAFVLPLAGVVSRGHALDVVNEALMLAPLLPALLVMGWAGRGQPSPARGAWLTRSGELAFALSMLGPCAVYLVFFRSGIGMARDWDLFTMAVAGIVPASAITIHRFAASAADGARWPSVAAPMALLMVVLGASWVGVNASGPRTARRFERILDNDRTHAGYAYENLATYYRLHGDLDRAIDRMHDAAESTGNPRYDVFLATLYVEKGDSAAALHGCMETLRTHPERSDARLLAATILEKEGRFSELADLARDGTLQHTEDPSFWFFLGEASIRLGNVDDGVAALGRARAANPSPEMRRRIDALLRSTPVPNNN